MRRHRGDDVSVQAAGRTSSPGWFEAPERVVTATHISSDEVETGKEQREENLRRGKHLQLRTLVLDLTQPDSELMNDQIQDQRAAAVKGSGSGSGPAKSPFLGLPSALASVHVFIP